MSMYILFAVLASLIQIATIYLMRVDILKSFLFAIPFILIHQYLFLYNYTKAPNFIVIWFITVAVTSLSSLVVGHFVFKDILTTYQLVGVILIISGLVLLKF